MDNPTSGEVKAVNRLALVTGAAHRVGKALAMCLAANGYNIVLHYHSASGNAEATGQEIRAMGVQVFPVRADLMDEASIRSLFEFVDKLDGMSLRVLVNSAAVMNRADARNMGIAEFDDAINLNLRAPLLLSQLAYARMDEGGLVVNVSDIAAQKAWTGFPAYTISKAGLDALTKVLARTFAPKVRVNAIAPGLVLPAEDMPAEEWDRLVLRLPIKRAGQVDELGSALEFLLKNEYITGQTIAVDGGYSLL